MQAKQLNPAATNKMLAEVAQAILRLRIACYLTDNGEMSRRLTSEVAFYLVLGSMVSAARWPKARPTALLMQALDSLMDVAEDDCRWQKHLAPLLDYALDRSGWVFAKMPDEALARAEAASLVQDAVLHGAVKLARAPAPSYARIAA